MPPFIEDTQCGFKVYKKEVAKILFNNLQSKAMMFDLEIILRAKKNNFKIATFPVSWTNDPDSKFDLIPGIIQNLQEIYHIKFNLKL